MKKLILSWFTLITICVTAQEAKTEKLKLYDPSADAKADIKAAVEKANKEGKHVLLQVGGNWCKWCLRFNEKATSNDTIRNEIEKNYVVYHLNYSKENENLDVLASLGYPQRFGFPVFVILDGKGNRLHTQSSGYLEEGKGHGTSKIMDFLTMWTPAAVDPKNYEKKK
jgi:thioredoxin-related protein